MRKITEILQSYAILPQAVTEVTDRLYKIKANGKQYALKWSRLNRESLENWLSVYHTASKKNLHEIIPVYLTRQNELYVDHEDEIYYLMPWIDKNARHVDENCAGSFYRQLARIHVQTKNLYDLNKEELVRSFESYQKGCDRDEQRLIAWVEKLEQIHYPSPFELQVLTYYRDLRISLNRSKHLADRIISLSESEASWGPSLVHGRLEPDHIFEHYILNWEQASYNHAIYDLLHMIHHKAVREPQVLDYFIESFSDYLDENPLSKLELCLFSLYLLDAGDCLRLIETNIQPTKRRQNHLELSIKMEQSYRKMRSGMDFDAAIDRLETSEV